MSYEWDPQKAKSNYLKHAVHFADAVAALEDEFALSREDVGRYGEERFILVGMDHLARILTVVFTFRGKNVRLISAREATNNERKSYERRRI